jgi:uncharacterized membrane protein HdeD (DUF308 family)
MSQKTKKLFSSYIFDGFLLVALGVVMLIWTGTYDMLCYIIGGIAALLGVLKVVSYIVNKSGERKALNLLLGVILFAFGLALIIRPSFFETMFQVITGVILVYGAIIMFIHAIKLRKEKGAMFVMSLVFACLTTIFAVLVFIDPFDPESKARVVVHAVALIIEGLAMIAVLHNIKPDEPKKLEGAEDYPKLESGD